MSYCRSGRNKYLGAVLGSALLWLGGCIQQTEMRPAEKQQNVPAEQPHEPKAAAPSPSGMVARDPLARPPESARMGAAITTPSHYPYPRPPYYPRPPVMPPSADRFPDKEPTRVLSAAEHPVSTFSVDVDTASYALMRRSLTGGRMPPRESVRVEELVNYLPLRISGP